MDQHVVRVTRWLSVATLATVVSACGGGPATGNPTAGPGVTTGANATPGINPTEGSGPVGGDCPLTAEQVSGILGATVVAAGACTFFPPDDAPGVTPNAIYNHQLALACNSTERAELGYTESLDGLGAEAWVQRDVATGTMILVCGDRPFEVTVDMVADLSNLPADGFEDALAAAQAVAASARFEAAKALAELVLTTR